MSNINHKDLLCKSSYFYDLPQDLIAQQPVEPRDSSRLLIFCRESEKIEDKHFYDIVDYFQKGDVLVINNTRVLPARLFGYKDTGAKIEVLLQKRLDLKRWKVIARPFKRLSPGTEIHFSEKLSAVVRRKAEYGECEIEFSFSGAFEERLLKLDRCLFRHISMKSLRIKKDIRQFMQKLKALQLRLLLDCILQNLFLKK